MNTKAGIRFNGSYIYVDIENMKIIIIDAEGVEKEYNISDGSIIKESLFTNTEPISSSTNICTTDKASEYDYLEVIYKCTDVETEVIISEWIDVSYLINNNYPARILISGIANNGEEHFTAYRAINRSAGYIKIGGSVYMENTNTKFSDGEKILPIAVNGIKLQEVA